LWKGFIADKRDPVVPQIPERVHGQANFARRISKKIFSACTSPNKISNRTKFTHLQRIQCGESGKGTAADGCNLIVVHSPAYVSWIKHWRANRFKEKTETLTILPIEEGWRKPHWVWM
jgi:hypothetical protein